MRPAALFDGQAAWPAPGPDLIHGWTGGEVHPAGGSPRGRGTWYGQRARRDRRRLNDRGRGPAVRGEQVQDRFEVVDRTQVNLHEEAVFAGDPVALGDVRHLAGDPGDEPQSPARRADPDDGADRVPEGARADLGAVGQGAGLL